MLRGASLRCARLKRRSAMAAALPRRGQSSSVVPATATASSSIPSSSGTSLDSTSFLPPQLSYLGQTARQQSSPFAAGISVPTGSIVEQLAILEICLAIGNLSRAKRIFSSIRKAFHEEKALQRIESGGPSSSFQFKKTRLSDVVPVSVHTAFLRTFFRQALVHNSTNSKGAAARKRTYVSEAWEWFDMLIKEERLHGKLEDAAWAVMLKGMVATRLTNPSTRMPDPTAPHLRSIAYLYSLTRTHRRSLENILRDPMFSHAGLAGLNDHPALEVVEELLAVLSANGEQDIIDEVEIIRARLVSDLRYQSEQEDDPLLPQEVEIQAQERIEPTVEGPNLQPARRSQKETTPFRLESLLGNLTTISGQRLETSDPYVRQDLLEESAYDAARWQSIHDSDQLEKIGLGTDVKLKNNVLQGHMKKWLDALTETLRDQLAIAANKTPNTGIDYDVASLLSMMDPGQLALMTIVETLRQAGNSSLVEGVKATRAIIMLGRTIEEEFGAQAWKVLYPDLYDQAMQATAREPKMAVRRFMTEQGIAAGAANAARREGYGDEADDLRDITDAAEKEAKLQARERAMPWTQKMRAKVGGFLIKALLDVAYIERKEKLPSGEWVVQEQPAFFQSYQFFRGTKIGVLKVNQEISNRLDKDPMDLQVFPRFLPMLVPPKPWTRWNSGGYRIHSTEIMRMRDSPEQLQYIKAASEQGQLGQVYAALDVLGRTPWVINKPIFDIVTQVWNSGESLADIPMDNAGSNMPDPAVPEGSDMKDPRLREAFRVQLKQVRNDRSKAHSQRCDLNYKLEIAKAYLNETFYFPHNLDFRGRAYPIPPNLSHIGDDISRGLLKFAVKKKLGSRGLVWLHIQVANSFGFDKASFVDRENWTKERLKDVMNSADKPLEGQRWWLKADDPWQCLAACMELTNALRSPVPEEFESQLPVQQDGTCNGLQHYAALGGDETGAAQVNLAKGEKPADVYTAVAKLVNAEIEKDLMGSNEQLKKTAEVLNGKVTRKVVKQTVMTTVYGVTFIGAKRQIQRQLKDRGDIPLADQFGAATYLAERVLSSIGDLFKGASAIQIWLSICARLIGRAVRVDPEGGIPTSKDPMASVIWTTPLGLPVAQPYRKQKKSQITTALQTVFITDPNMPAVIDARAQATAFPPNFVHSLDATHMMMTAIECERLGLAFASVHDSYWTHACDIDTMSASLRDCFIKLHSQDLLGNLRADFQARYTEFVVRKGSVTTFAQNLSKNRDNTDEVRNRDLSELAKDLGASALPPLAVAAEKQLMQDAVKAAEADQGELGDEEDGEDGLEGRSFEMDGGEEEGGDEMSSNMVEPESDADVQASAEGEGKEEATEPVKKGRPPKGSPARGKYLRKSKAKSKVAKAAKARAVEELKYLPLPALLPEVPPKGNFDLELIRTSPYFFS